MGTLKDFTVWVDTLSDGKGYMLMGKIMNDNNVVFYVPFEPTIKDFSTILQKFRKSYSVTDSFTFKILIQPARYRCDEDNTGTLLCQ